MAGRNIVCLSLYYFVSISHKNEPTKLTTKTGHHHATPLVTPFLRIPLPWYTSYTFPLYPDEKTPTIRRACASHSPPFTLRYFCGYCGTPLSYWRESPAREKDF